MLVYNKHNGEIVGIIPPDQNISSYFYHYSQEFKDSLESIFLENYPTANLHHYKIIEGKLTHRTDREIKELKMYGRILNDEERIIEQMKPSYMEVQEAEQTIKLLSLLQEVL